jgi:hypothetical protein
LVVKTLTERSRPPHLERRGDVDGGIGSIRAADVIHDALRLPRLRSKVIVCQPLDLTTNIEAVK